MLKKLVLLTLLVSLWNTIISQTLFSYGSKAVTKSEFLKAYNKNPNLEEGNHTKAITDYLNLYTNYKLKVQAAFDDKLNELPTFKYESKK